jgi:hypothetical protein
MNKQKHVHFIRYWSLIRGIGYVSVISIRCESSYGLFPFSSGKVAFSPFRNQKKIHTDILFTSILTIIWTLFADGGIADSTIIFTALITGCQISHNDIMICTHPLICLPFSGLSSLITEYSWQLSESYLTVALMGALLELLDKGALRYSKITISNGVQKNVLKNENCTLTST